MSPAEEKCLEALLVVPATAELENGDTEGMVAVRFEFDLGQYQIQAKAQLSMSTTLDIESGRTGRKAAFAAKDGKIVPVAILLMGKWYDLEVV